MAAYQKWAENHAMGMAAARAKTESRRLRGQALAERRQMMRERYPCKVKGCKRAAYKGAICKAHWGTLPMKAKLDMTIAVMNAQRKETQRWHARFLRRLNAEAHSD